MSRIRLFLDSGSPTLYNQLARKKEDNATYMGSFLKDRKNDDYSWLEKPEYLSYRDEYVEYIKQHKNDLEVYVNLDIINNPEETWKNQKYFESKGLNPLPVWHFGSDISFLKRYLAEGYTYIGIGGLVPNPYTILRPALDELFGRYLCGKDGMPLVKVHGFAATSIKMMCRYPWYCMSKKHKVLTKQGWKNHNEVSAGTEILCHDINGNSVWKPVLKKHYYRNADIVNIKKQRFHAEITPNHRWMMYNKKTDKRYFRETTDLRDRRNEVIERFGNYEFPEKETYSNEYVELAAWYFTDGAIKNRPRYKHNSIAIYQSQKSNPALCKRIRELLIRLNESFCEMQPTIRDSSIQWEIYGSNSIRLLEEFPRKVPTWEFLFALTKEQCDLFIDTCYQADGYSLVNKRKDTFGIREEEKYQQLIWTLQVAMFLRKRPSSVRKEELTEKGLQNMFCLQESSQDFISTAIFGDKENPIWKQSEKTQGDVWCVEVETGAFYTQCDGHIYVTGNSVDSASWIKYAAYGWILIPQKVNGKFKYTEQPHLINFSSKSPRKSIKGKHYDNVGPAIRDQINEYIDMWGFKLGKSRFEFNKKKNKEIEIIEEPGLINRAMDRSLLTGMYYTGLTKELPEWPWSFKAKGLSLF